MLDIEYRRKSVLDHPFEASRRDVYDFSEYLNTLVDQVRFSGINIKLREIDIPEGSEDRNDVVINGRSVAEILEGLDLVLPGSKSCGNCSGACGTSDGCGGGERDDLEWNEDIIEDIPDIIFKNAVSKALADSREN